MLYKNDNFRICAFMILYTFTIYIHELNLLYAGFSTFTMLVSLQIFKIQETFAFADLRTSLCRTFLLKLLYY